MTSDDTITRKEIARLCPVLTYGAVRKREVSLGLVHCRIDGFSRPILYRRSEVIVILVKAGLVKDVSKSCR